MRKLFTNRGAKSSEAILFKKFELMTDLLEAIKYLNPTASDEQVMFMGTTALLAIVNATALDEVVATVTEQAITKTKEVSVLTDMFSAPATTDNNN
jgi:hypothetical protein